MEEPYEITKEKIFYVEDQKSYASIKPNGAA